MGFKGAIFDLDGTILESMHVWRKIDVDFLNKRGLAVPQDYMEKIVSMNFEEAAEFTIQRFGFPESKEEIIREWFDMAVYAYGHDVGFKPNAWEYLSYLKSKDVPMVVATSSDEALYQATFDHLGLNSVFQDVVTAKQVGFGKNRPDVYLEAARRLGLSVSDCVVFEDIYMGMKSAQEAGFYVVIMEDDSSLIHRERLKSEADLYLTDFSQLLKKDVLF